MERSILDTGKLLESMVLCSEKAANLARLLKMQDSIFQSLVQEKNEAEANARFSVDIKTLADVLIQEVIKYDLDALFPGFAKSVFGEENNQFCNTAGKSVTFRISSSKSELASLLSQVLNGDLEMANNLSDMCLRPLDSFTNEPAVKNTWEFLERTVREVHSDFSSPVSAYGIWIDPIDSTAEYARGHLAGLSPESDQVQIRILDVIPNRSNNNSNSKPDQWIRYFPGTLINVSVLVGLFNRQTGLPIVGVINQPFYQIPLDESNGTNQSQMGRLFWGIYLPRAEFSRFSQSCLPLTSIPEGSTYPKHAHFPDQFCKTLCPNQIDCCRTLRIVCSSMEFKKVGKAFTDFRLNDQPVQTIILSSPGAGFKLLCVILEEMDVYLLNEPNTFLWDTCGPHAILRSIGGRVIRFREALHMVRRLLQIENPSVDDLPRLVENILLECELTYNIFQTPQTSTDWKMKHSCNRDGLLAFKNSSIAVSIMIHLAQGDDFV